MRNVLAIAGITLRDAIRQKLAVNLLLFALLVIAASIALSRLTFGEQHRIIADLALSSAALFGTLIAVFLGAGLVAGDVQRRSVYPVLAKPVSRAEYVLGRYAGLGATLLLNLAVMAATTAATLIVYRGSLEALRGAFFAAFAGIGVQLLVVAAIAVLFSCFTNATLAAMMTLALTLAGHFTREALPFWNTSPVARTVSYLIPNLSALDLKVEVVYERAVAGGVLAAALAYGLLYAAVCLSLATAIFARRDLR